MKKLKYELIVEADSVFFAAKNSVGTQYELNIMNEARDNLKPTKYKTIFRSEFWIIGDYQIQVVQYAVVSVIESGIYQVKIYEQAQ